MYRNQNSHFAEVPRADIRRSKFRRPSSLKTSGNIGEIIPIFLDEVLPADTFQLKTSFVARLQTLVAPIMDNLYIDTFFFYVPCRILWEHWKEFQGENTASKWIPTADYSVPQITAPEGGWQVGTIADYLGVPTGKDISVNALPFRAYAMIMNEFFRDENNSDYLDIPFGDATVQGVNSGTFVTDVAKGGKPYKAAKYHDYFTSCLPSPLKGDDVLIPAGTASSSGSLSGTFPVVGNGKNLAITDGANVSGLKNGTDSYTPYFSFAVPNGNNVGKTLPSSVDSSAGAAISYSSLYGVASQSQLGENLENSGLIAIANQLPVTVNTSLSLGTINDLRLAFATQHVLERDARGGSRYREMLLSHFGVVSPDARQNIPEYLGGVHVPINVNQVVQTSGEVGNTPQGNVAAYSVTSDVSGNFIKSFTEHGYILGVAVIRYDHTYQQGLDKLWSRKKRFDFFMPEFANIGEQPVFNKEIYCQGTDVDDEVFGFQEAWAEYRYKPSKSTSEMRSTYAQSLDVWHLGDNYNSLPVLQSDWIFEDKSNLDRCLQVSSALSNQFWADFFFDLECTRPMPVFSVPGLKTL